MWTNYIWGVDLQSGNATPNLVQRLPGLNDLVPDVSDYFAGCHKMKPDDRWSSSSSSHNTTMSLRVKSLALLVLWICVVS